MLRTIPKIRGKRGPAKDGKKPEKLDVVSSLMRQLFPGCPFMTVLWHPVKKEKRYLAELVTNCEVGEVVTLLRDTAEELERTGKLQAPRGNA